MLINGYCCTLQNLHFNDIESQTSHNHDLSPVVLPYCQKVELLNQGPIQKGMTVPVQAMKAYEGMEVQLHPFFTLTLDGGK